MNSRALRFLAFSLGFLLLFHGVDRIIYGVDSIENMFIAYVVPSSQYSDPCSICFNYGTAFMGKMIVPYSFPSVVANFKPSKIKLPKNKA
jgi:hypothetical protein